MKEATIIRACSVLVLYFSCVTVSSALDLTNIRPGQEIQDKINLAVSSGEGYVRIEPGNYTFQKPLYIRASDLKIFGAGPMSVQLWFTPGYGIDVQSSSNLTLEGFSLDTMSPPFSQGKLIFMSLRDKYLNLEIEEGFPLPTLFNQTCSNGSEGICGEIKAVFWDPDTRKILQNQQMTNPMRNSSCNGRLCNVSLIALDSAWTNPPPPGALVTLSPRLWASKYPIPTFYKGTIGIFNCSECLFQDIDIYSSGDMAIVENLGKGGNRYRRVRVVRRPAPLPYPPRLLASNLDAFHSMSCERGPILEDSEFAYLADDFINVHNRVLPLARLDRNILWLLDVGNCLGHDYNGPITGKINSHISHGKVPIYSIYDVVYPVTILQF